jgi:cytochrome c oxidase subunit 3
MPTALVERARAGAGSLRGIGGRGPGPSGGGARPQQEPGPLSTGLVGVAAFVGAVTMLFLAFTSAYVVRQQEAGWTALAIPPVLWINTALLLASSGTLEWARRRIQRGDEPGLRRGVEATAALGTMFVVGQVFAWRQLGAQGMFLSTNPHSSFFYVLTATHGAHLLGGIAALGVVLVRTWQHRYTAGGHAGLVNCAVYWHFLDLLWLYLFVLLFWV